MTIQGAGGTNGGIGRFFLGVAMFVAGAYLFLNSIVASQRFSFGYGLFQFGGMSVTSGMVLIPFVFGLGMIFYNGKNLLGWFLAAGSLMALGFGVIASLDFRLRPMTAFDIIVILVLLVGGLILFLTSLRDLSQAAD